MIPIPLINGHRYSFASLEFSLIKPDGTSEIFIDCSELSYSDALNIELVPGASQAPIGWTAGMYEPGDASATLGKSSFQTGIVEAIGDGWLGSNLQIVAKYNDVGEPLTVDEVICRISGAEDAHSTGPGPLNVKMGLKVLVIVRNGVSPLKNHPR